MKKEKTNLQTPAQGLYANSLVLVKTATGPDTVIPAAHAQTDKSDRVEYKTKIPRKYTEAVVTEMLRAFQFMRDNEDLLDQKVLAYIHTQKFRSRLVRVVRVGNWYMEDGFTLHQCCVCRLFFEGARGWLQPTLREYSIPVGDIAGVGVSVRRDRG